MRPVEIAPEKKQNSNHPLEGGEDPSLLVPRVASKEGIELVWENFGESRFKDRTNGYHRANGGFGSFNPHRAREEV